MKKLRFTITIIVMLAAVLLAASLAYGLSEEYEPLTVRCNGQTVAGPAYMYRGTPYIQLTTLRSYGDCSSVTFNEADAKAEFSVASLDIFIADSETTNFVKANAGTCYLYLKRIDGVMYAPLNTLSSFCRLAYKLEGSDLIIAPYADSSEFVHIAPGGATGASSFFGGAGKTVSLSGGQPMYLMSQTASSYKLRTLFGEIVYVDKSAVNTDKSAGATTDFSFTAKQKKDYSSEKINLVWHNIGTSTQKAPVATDGIDIVSPVYFRQVVNGDGDVYNYASLGYTDLCHDRGFDVWATINNNMALSGSTNTSHKVLNDEALRNKSIAQYLFYAALYDVDGIDIDYEDLKDDDRAGFTAFTLTMSTYCKRMGLTLAAALPPVRSWYVEYDYAALGAACDYITVMTYDEHYSGSTSAGSVSSKGWYCNAVEGLMQYVPANKIMLGIPFYSRLWTVNSSGKVLSNPAYGMDSMRSKIEASGATPGWDAQSGQYYVEYGTESGTVKVWLEDNRSLATRLDTVYKYNLAGTCCWELTQASADVFDEVFAPIFKQGVSPSLFELPY